MGVSGFEAVISNTVISYFLQIALLPIQPLTGKTTEPVDQKA